MGRGFDDLYLNSKCNGKVFSIRVFFLHNKIAISWSISVLLVLVGFLIILTHSTMCKIHNFARKMGGSKFGQVYVFLASRDYI